MTPDHERLLAIISKHDRAHPILRRECLDAFNEGYKEPISDKTLSRLKMELFTLYGQFVGSDQTGYFMIKTDEDLAIAQAYHRSKAMPHLVQEKALGEAWARVHGSQMKLIA
jgi:hypothetical protein